MRGRSFHPVLVLIAAAALSAVAQVTTMAAIVPVKRRFISHSR